MRLGWEEPEMCRSSLACMHMLCRVKPTCCRIDVFMFEGPCGMLETNVTPGRQVEHANKMILSTDKP